MLQPIARTVHPNGQPRDVPEASFPEGSPLLAGGKELEAALPTVRLGPPEVSQRVQSPLDYLLLVVPHPLDPLLVAHLVNPVGIGHMDGEPLHPLLILDSHSLSELEEALRQVPTLRLKRWNQRIDPAPEVQVVGVVEGSLLPVSTGQPEDRLRGQPLRGERQVLRISLLRRRPPLLPRLLIGLDVLRLRGDYEVTSRRQTTYRVPHLPQLVGHLQYLLVHRPSGFL